MSTAIAAPSLSLDARLVLHALQRDRMTRFNAREVHQSVHRGIVMHTANINAALNELVIKGAVEDCLSGMYRLKDQQ